MGLFNFFGNGKKNGQPRVEVAPGISLIKPLADRWQELAATRLPSVKIDATPVQYLPLTKSKFGGDILLPRNIAYPTDSQGQRMFPLAQLNFSEIPPLEGYPQKGWLQFYTGINDIYGLDFDNPTLQKDFRILFFEELNENDVHTDTMPDESMYEHSPVITQHALSFSLQDDYVGIYDIRFHGMFGKSPSDFEDEFGEQVSLVQDDLDKYFSGAGHKIGGYAYFTQDDPRNADKPFSDYILLLQIDSIGDHIMWGDVGVANFFIHPDRLKAKNFSSVIYNWDCT
jgi:uncharacterized protein YwqG